MSWFKLDDGFDTHPKVIAAGNAATGLFARCGVYCAKQLTDGFIHEAVAQLYGTAEEIERLLNVGLWERTTGGYRMPDYLDYNPSRQKVKDERKKTAERVARWKERHANAVTNELVTPPPTRPDPTRPRTSSLLTTTTASTVGETAAAAVEIYATADMATRPVRDIHRKPSYRNGIVTRVLAEYGTELAAYTAEHPDASPVDVACAVLGLDRPSALRADRTRQEAS